MKINEPFRKNEFVGESCEQETESQDEIYGSCSYCGAPLEPIFFRNKKNRMVGVDVLVCPVCLREECVDDTFDIDEVEFALMLVKKGVR